MIDTFSVRQLKIPDLILTHMIAELDEMGSWRKAVTFDNAVDYRSTKVKFINSSHFIGNLCRDNVMDVNSEMYNFDLRKFDNNHFQYAHYNVNDYYQWHMDTDNRKNASKSSIRKLSFSLVLNDDYEGGVLQIATPQKPNSEDPYHIFSVPKKRGTLVVFPSHMFHQVTSVTHGIRKSVVGWLVGPPLR